mgnify:FL=1|tara:strand:+ start:85 stop:306 length:222 start_codon:yes stop_codon:yes gene_type:complete
MFVTDCPICEDTGIDDRLANFRACGHCRKGKVLRLNYLRIHAAEMQQEVYSTEREIKHLEQTIPVIKSEAQHG